jgi:hypothetical protein
MSYKHQIKDFKVANTQLMSYLLSKDGGLAPMITVLVKKNEELNVVAIPVPGEFLDSDESKDALANAIPSLFQHLVKEGLEPICFSWSSEAWLRKTPEGTTEVPDDWKDLPKTECLISTYESRNESSMDIHEIVREGKMANEDGELIDAIVLKPYHTSDNKEEKPTNIEGRFSKMFNEYFKTKENE